MCKNLTDECIQLVSLRLTSLCAFSVPGTDITDDGVKFIANGCKKLELLVCLNIVAHLLEPIWYKYRSCYDICCDHETSETPKALYIWMFKHLEKQNSL